MRVVLVVLTMLSPVSCFCTTRECWRFLEPYQPNTKVQVSIAMLLAQAIHLAAVTRKRPRISSQQGTSRCTWAGSRH